jgi:hypothetical protein
LCQGITIQSSPFAGCGLQSSVPKGKVNGPMSDVVLRFIIGGCQGIAPWLDRYPPWVGVTILLPDSQNQISRCSEAPHDQERGQNPWQTTHRPFFSVLSDHIGAQSTAHTRAKLTMIDDIIRGAIALSVADNDRALTRDIPAELAQSICPQYVQTNKQRRHRGMQCLTYGLLSQRISAFRALLLTSGSLSPARWRPTICEGGLEYLIHPIS